MRVKPREYVVYGIGSGSVEILCDANVKQNLQLPTIGSLLCKLPCDCGLFIEGARMGNDFNPCSDPKIILANIFLATNLEHDVLVPGMKQLSTDVAREIVNGIVSGEPSTIITKHTTPRPAWLQM